jgi:TRAP-type mannitol/chloroaromatic compound transport system substrate-binding protein
MKTRLVVFFCILGLLAAAIGCAADAQPVVEDEGAPSDTEDQEQEVPSAPEGEVITWKIETTTPMASKSAWGLAEMARIIPEATGGRLIVEAYGAGEIVEAFEIHDAVLDGVLDAGNTSAFYAVGKWPDAPLFNTFPISMGPEPYLAWLYQGDGEELWQEMYKDYDVKNFPFTMNGPELFGWYNKPIKSFDDFDGLKFRTGGYWGEILTAAGASVVMMAPGELYEAMERGVLDAFELNTPATDYSLGYHEVADYVGIPGIHAPCSVQQLFINGERWRELPDDVKVIVEEVCQAVTITYLGMSNAQDALYWQKILDYGVTPFVVPDEMQQEIVARAEALYDAKSADDAFFAKVWESHKSFKSSYEGYLNANTPGF